MGIAGSFLLVHGLLVLQFGYKLCSSVGIKWENGGISPIALVRQQSYAKQDGAAEQPEAHYGKSIRTRK